MVNSENIIKSIDSITIVNIYSTGSIPLPEIVMLCCETAGKKTRDDKAKSVFILFDNSARCCCWSMVWWCRASGTSDKAGSGKYLISDLLY